MARQVAHHRRVTRRESIGSGKSARKAGSTEIPPSRVPVRCDHSPRSGSLVCSLSIAPSLAARHVPKGTESVPVHHSLMTQTGACPAKIVRGERGSLTDLRLLLHYTPNDRRTEAGSPDSAGLIDRTKQSAGRDAGGSRTGINFCSNPMRTGLARICPPLPTRSAMTQ